MKLSEAATSSSSTGLGDNTLPVVFESTEDPTLNNLTRSDVNCDKTGTCYDGKFTFFILISNMNKSNFPSIFTLNSNPRNFIYYFSSLFFPVHEIFSLSLYQISWTRMIYVSVSNLLNWLLRKNRLTV